MAIVETTARNIPCDNPSSAAELANDYAEALAGGALLRVENEGKSEYVNPNHVVGITDGTND